MKTHSALSTRTTEESSFLCLGSCRSGYKLQSQKNTFGLFTEFSKKVIFLMDRQHFLDKSSFDFTGNDQQQEKVHVADTTTDELDKRHFVRPEQRIEIKTPDVYKFNLISRGREKKIHIGGQMSIAKKTSTTWEDVIISTLFPTSSSTSETVILLAFKIGLP